MTKQSELAAQLRELSGQLRKVDSEIHQKIDDLRTTRHRIEMAWSLSPVFVFHIQG